MGFKTKCFNCGKGELVIVNKDLKKIEVKAVCNRCRSVFFIDLKEEEKEKK